MIEREATSKVPIHACVLTRHPSADPSVPRFPRRLPDPDLHWVIRAPQSIRAPADRIRAELGRGSLRRVDACVSRDTATFASKYRPANTVLRHPHMWRSRPGRQRNPLQCRTVQPTRTKGGLGSSYSVHLPRAHRCVQAGPASGFGWSKRYCAWVRTSSESNKMPTTRFWTKCAVARPCSPG